ncbi:unnamed protein product [Rotaria magnacalcarata]|uniref:Uncharacterized protein n=1 Tax=Rotaria magnacalcarata TaxID=392030 RepID=A0A816PFK6_9BILA|nr:unnamed protein product [Rotaria magnacalcarata]CAF1531952.1 unnamed protein product [Rotaria magnacalcarata]CAF2047965.1 unnamed protein product [Rotaria magnacalcarata]CAF2124894.1 unnamed protein product [Rotaria magnacalcarata]CAF2134606.1 unnamed protein product [Rotaria magnacalcarata]
MFHKYNSFANTLSPSDRISAYIPQGFGTKETTNNFFLAPQPKSSHASGSQSHAEGNLTSPKTSMSASHTGNTVTASSTTTAAAKAHTTAATSTGHGHASHAAPWEGVNLWRTPFKGDTDTITQVKRNKGILDQYIENRTRRIQQLQLLALRNKSKPTWIMMPRDKLFFAAQGIIVAYVLYQVTTSVYNHLKAKDRLKLIKLFYKDNVN